MPFDTETIRPLPGSNSRNEACCLASAKKLLFDGSKVTGKLKKILIIE
jgi:hypothetical protein